MLEQVQQLCISVGKVQHHRSGKATQHGRYWLGVDAGEGKAGAWLCEYHRVVIFARILRSASQMQRQILTVCTQQTKPHRNHKRLFDALARWSCRGRAALFEGEGVGAGSRVVHALCMDTRRAGLAVPALELRQQARQLGGGVGIAYRLRKIVAGHGVAVVALEVQRHPLGEAVPTLGVVFASDQGLHHAHDFGTFFVNRDGIEVADFDVAVRPHRVRHRACIFGELCGAQHANVLDALDGAC